MRFLIFLFTCVLCCFTVAYGTRRDMHAKMYVKLDSNAACFRRLNGTHQFGCSSNRNGNLGIIHVIRNRNDLDYFMDSHHDYYYVITLYMDMFISDVMNRLKTNNKVSGVVIIVQKPHIPAEYSPDDVCDNSMDNCDNSTISWNPRGNKFLYYDWPFPIFVADDLSTITEITQCYTNFNTPFEKSSFSRPLCSLQLKSHMSAAVDSPTCLRRISQAGVSIYKYCDPMGDQNIILPMDTWNETTSRDVVIISTRLDTASMFDGLAPGGMTSVTSFVTTLTAAHVFSTLQSKIKDSDTSLVFMLLNGEAQDHIGSSRIVYDIEKGLFPAMTSFNITLKNIKYFFEISQIGDSPNIFMHPSDELYSDKIMEDFIAVGRKYSLDWSLSSRKELPPSSVRVFKKAHEPLPGLVISNYDKEYTNKYYNGLLDTSESLGYKYANGSISDQHILQKNIASLASTIASVLFNKISGSGSADNIPQEEIALLVDELLYCYLENKACKLMNEIINIKEEPVAKIGALPLYVGVQPSLNPITTQTGLLLAYLTSKPINISKENCTAGSNSNQISYFWLNGENSKGLCINTTLKFTPAVSPAFLIPDYNWTSRLYSTWTESVWNDVSLEMFLKPSRKQEIITLACGIGTSIISVLVVYYINKNNKFVNIFSRPSPTVC
ncbi:nicastrin [Halyomorpha halys]|uniref:nicastrin n=1 Tax=Halyomorpha halys TaxID=286706 RepID=UPI0006D514C9|nr:nicastrin [Halyomorpha halys]